MVGHTPSRALACRRVVLGQGTHPSKFLPIAVRSTANPSIPRHPPSVDHPPPSGNRQPAFTGPPLIHPPSTAEAPPTAINVHLPIRNLRKSAQRRPRRHRRAVPVAHVGDRGEQMGPVFQPQRSPQPSSPSPEQTAPSAAAAAVAAVCDRALQSKSTCDRRRTRDQPDFSRRLNTCLGPAQSPCVSARLPTSN